MTLSLFRNVYMFMNANLYIGANLFTNKMSTVHDDLHDHNIMPEVRDHY